MPTSETRTVGNLIETALMLMFLSICDALVLAWIAIIIVYAITGKGNFDALPGRYIFVFLGACLLRQIMQHINRGGKSHDAD